MDIFLYHLLLVLAYAGLSHKSLEIIYLTYLNLEILYSNLFKTVNYSCNDLSIGSRRIIIYKLCSNLCNFLQFTLKL